jgi:hypothetical protein
VAALTAALRACASVSPRGDIGDGTG